MTQMAPNRLELDRKRCRRLANAAGQTLSNFARRQEGQAFVAVLMLLAVGGLMLPPLLDMVATGLLTGGVYETTIEEFYSADAGVEDALWQIKADELETLFPDYDRYAFSGYDGTDYSYSDYPGTASAPELNAKDVDITIENEWVPLGIDAPSHIEAQTIIDDAKLIVTGTVVDAATYRIKLTYNYQDVTDPDWDELEVDVLGIWLPPGFTYDAESSNLEEDPLDDYYCVPTTQAYKSGQAILWDFNPAVLFTDLPGIDLGDYPITATVTFQFSSSGAGLPDTALAWVTTTGVSDVDYAWDADVRVFRISSTATSATEGTSTTIDAYTARSEIRRLSAAIAGDYIATGGSLLEPTGSSDRYRNRLYKESSATIQTDDTGENGIPTQGIPEAAFLYWTGWIDWHGYDASGDETIIFEDACNNFNNWTRNGYHNDWSWYYYGYSRGGIFDGHRVDSYGHDLILKNALALAEYSGQPVTVSWLQWTYYSNIENGDSLMYAIRDSNGVWGPWHYSVQNAQIPGNGSLPSSPSSSSSRYSVDLQSLGSDDGRDYISDSFLIRFQLPNGAFEGSSEYCELDDITVSVTSGGGGSLEYPDNPTAENLRALIEDSARTNLVLCEAGGSAPLEVTADIWSIEPSEDLPGDDTFEGTWSYCCFADVTDSVRQWILDGYLNNNASGTYTLGHKPATNEVDPGYSFNLYVPSAPYEQTGYPLGTPAPGTTSPPCEPLRHQYCHCGWSLIVIYTSPETEGHQLYLFDIQNPDFEFTEAWHTNPDFDGDGSPGGRISGFLVPEPVAGEDIAAKVTVFVGEGDSLISDDQIKMNGHNLSNTASPWYNVWNSASPGLSVSGIDVDTFVIEWDDNILETGDSSAQVDLPTVGDGFNTVYIILSFRSEVTTGGTLSFLLSG